MSADMPPISVDSVVQDLFGLILCARPGEAAELRQLAGLPAAEGKSAANAAALAIALQTRMPAGEAAFARQALGDDSGATMADLDVALLARPEATGDERIAVILAGIRTGIAHRAGRLGLPVNWPELPVPTPPPGMRARAVEAATGATNRVMASATSALDMAGLTRALGAQMEELQAKMGKVNILIAGRSGVGKSTLINTIFGSEVAATGLGRPVTQDITWYEPDILPVRLCDTRGLELARYAQTLGALRDELKRGEVHILWLCIAEPSARVEEAEREVLAMCAAQGIPGIAVLTKAFLLDDMTEAAREALPGVSDVVRVMAKGEPPRGIVDLVQATLRLLDGPARAAFNAAQQVDIGAKRTAALRVAAGAAASAGLAAATPVPLADSAGVLMVNIGMVAGIAVAMGVPMSRANMAPVATSIVGALAVTFGARLAGGTILKLIPGVGSVLGGAINAGLASSATYGLGHGFTEYLCWFFRREKRMPAGDELAAGFQAFWAKWDRKKDAPPAGQG